MWISSTFTDGTLIHQQIKSSTLSRAAEHGAAVLAALSFLNLPPTSSGCSWTSAQTFIYTNERKIIIITRPLWLEKHGRSLVVFWKWQVEAHGRLLRSLLMTRCVSLYTTLPCCCSYSLCYLYKGYLRTQKLRLQIISRCAAHRVHQFIFTGECVLV